MTNEIAHPLGDGQPPVLVGIERAVAVQVFELKAVDLDQLLDSNLERRLVIIDSSPWMSRTYVRADAHVRGLPIGCTPVTAHPTGVVGVPSST